MELNIVDGVLIEVKGKETHVKIPDGVKEISGKVFKNHEEIKTIEFPNDLERIGRDAFINCSSLTELHFPDNLKEINWNAFNGCIGLTKIHLPDSLEKIEDDIFSGCENLTTIHLPNRLNTIEIYEYKALRVIIRNLFADCKKINTIIFPDNIKKIGINSLVLLKKKKKKIFQFSDDHSAIFFNYKLLNPNQDTCSAIESLFTDEINDQKIMLFILKLCALYGTLDELGWLLDSIKSHNFTLSGKNIRKTFEEIFSNCDDKTFELIIEKGELPRLQKNKMLEEYVLNDKEERIRVLIHYGIIDSKYIDQALEIANQHKKTSMVSFLLNEKNNLKIRKKDGQQSTLKKEKVEKPIWDIQLIDEKTGFITAYHGKDTIVEFPQKVGNIKICGVGSKKYGTNNYKNITSIVIPEGYTTIDNYAFAKCKSLQKITLPNTLKRICSHAFDGCSFLQKINFPNQLEYIGDYAFANNPNNIWTDQYEMLNFVILSNNITSLGSRIFDGRKLKTVIFPLSLKTLYFNIFSRCYSFDDNGIIYGDGVVIPAVEKFYYQNHLDIRISALYILNPTMEVVGTIPTTNITIHALANSKFSKRKWFKPLSRKEIYSIAEIYYKKPLEKHVLLGQNLNVFPKIGENLTIKYQLNDDKIYVYNDDGVLYGEIIDGVEIKSLAECLTATVLTESTLDGKIMIKVKLKKNSDVI